jgi:hypothetical protein
VVGTEAVRVENRGSILRDFIAGKSLMALEASILTGFWRGGIMMNVILLFVPCGLYPIP